MFLRGNAARAYRLAFLTALVVGCVLVAINQGDLILAGASLPWVKIGLTFLVPYCVATWGAVTGTRAMLKKQMAARGG